MATSKLGRYDLILARRKAREAECSSDLTDGEVTQKRKIRKPVSSSDEEDDPFHHNKSLQKSSKRHIFENSEFINNNSQELVTPEPANSPSPLVLSPKTPQRTSTTCSSNTPVNHTPIYPVLPGNSGRSAIPNVVADTTGFEYNSMKILNTILEQNNQILSWIRTQNELETLKTKKTPIQIPINFPIKEEDDVHQIETFLEDDKNFADLVLYGGPIMDMQCRRQLMSKKIIANRWGDNFHEYSVTWAPHYIALSVDGEEWARVDVIGGNLYSRFPETCTQLPRMLLDKGTKIAPFDDFFYLTLGVAAGGVTEFPDDSYSSSGRPKPWRNSARKGMLAFWEDLPAWHSTWTQPELLVDSVKVVAL